ncbi:Putative metallopeptidase domain-containing protein [Ruminococcus sp. YRD2003]|nr:Putative metallopeptidase domain-containing protein [Ruminococcus flavefaciens]
MDRDEKIIHLSGQVLNNCRNTIILNLRFMDSALSRLKPLPVDFMKFGSDGRHLVYYPNFLLKSYVDNNALTVRRYFHTLLHCVFRHNFVRLDIDRRLWDIACDVAVESMIYGMSLPQLEAGRSNLLMRELWHFESELNIITAEKVYKLFRDDPPDEQQLSELEDIFSLDDHRLWYMPPNEKEQLGIGGNNNENSSDDDEQMLGDKQGSSTSEAPALCSEADWAVISRRIQVDMETVSKTQGDKADSMLQSLKALNREKYDYTSFLKKFAVMGEAMQVNDDEFDYIYYTYGLKLYNNMPLIEPLEYKDVKRIREFVIAIDTSGSVSGDLVQTFLNKTYNIMKQTESFFRKINVHIIQCDTEIQEHVMITSQEEFDNYIARMALHGFGGTDFRPVFLLVDKLLEQKKFTNLKGLIYFTDGYGDFPERKPPYETAFVFVEEDETYVPQVPPWAIKLVLMEDEI